MSLPVYVELATYKELVDRVAALERKLEDSSSTSNDYCDEEDLSGSISELTMSNIMSKPINRLIDRCIPELMSNNISSPAENVLPIPLTKVTNPIKIPEKKVRICRKEPKNAKRLDGTTKTYISEDSAKFWSAISYTYDKYKKAIPAPENRLRWNQFRPTFSKCWHDGSASDKELWSREGADLDWSNLTS